MNLFIMYLLHGITCHQFDVQCNINHLIVFYSSFSFIYNLGLPPGKYIAIQSRPTN